MFPLVASNSLLKGYADWLANLLNANHFLQLYQNDLSITPATPITDFIVADFLGYTGFNMAGVVPAPIKQVDGDYIISFTTSLFGCEGGSQTIYGAYITDGSSLRFSQAFPVPQPMTAGSSFIVPVQISVLALSILGL